VFGFSFERIDPPVPDIEMMFFPMSEQAAGLYGAPGALVKDPLRKPSKDGTLVYFSSMDCAVEASRVAAAGAPWHRKKPRLANMATWRCASILRAIPSASIQWSDICATRKKYGLDSQGIQPVRFARSEGQSTQ
jgi:predicted enzyme related to lactoylglutathione lyase